MKSFGQLMAVIGTLIVASTAAGPFASANARPVNNPLMRECYIKGGDFLDLLPGEVNDLPMCVFGSASVGAQALLDKISGQGDEAVGTFLAMSSSADPSQVCGQNGAQDLQGQDSDGNSYHLCQFEDGSLIDAATLARGVSDPRNAGLRAALN